MAMTRIGDELNISYSATNVPGISEDVDSLVSEAVTLIFRWVMYTFVCQGIDILGIVSNILNIICFWRQGFKDPVTVSLTGLAISDLGCLSTLLWTNICITPAFSELDLPFDAIDTQYITSGLLHTTFSRVTGWITVLITLERCICVISPLKVKGIITPKGMCITITCIYTILLSSVAPIYFVNRLDWKYFPAKNKTLLGLVYTQDAQSVETISFFINNVFVPYASFLVIIACTVILVINLEKNSKWRKNCTNVGHTDNVSVRNQKVSKMVVMISTLFITCYIPSSAAFIGIAFIPDVTINGKHKNPLLIIVGLGIVLESINSSVNIFIYYNMSSKYRSTILQLFSSCRIRSTGTDRHI